MEIPYGSARVIRKNFSVVNESYQAESNFATKHQNGDHESSNPPSLATSRGPVREESWFFRNIHQSTDTSPSTTPNSHKGISGGIESLRLEDASPGSMSWRS